MNIYGGLLMEIKNIAIVGMGALGIMYGEHIQKRIGKEYVQFVMDSQRYEVHKNDRYTVNGELQDFNIVESRNAKQADLVIIATKSQGLNQALDVMEPLVGEHTVMMSVMNGITSEEIIAERFGDRNLIYCVALGMDSMREGTDVQYKSLGRIEAGILKEEQRPALQATADFFGKMELAFHIKEDIKKALWGKLLMNVGINQTCTVYEACYKEVLNTREYFDAMSGAMHEVMAVAQKEGVQLTEEDYEAYVALIKTLQPEGYPSMRQDAVAKRKSEVELFAGTVMKVAEKHGVDVPVNRFYYERIKEMEAAY